MWGEVFLLIHFLEVAPPCRQGDMFPEAVVSPAVASSGILRVPGVASLSQCVAAGCDLPGFDLAWFFRGHCYILSCQQESDCRPRVRPGSDSVLAFLHRASPQSLLQSLVGGKPYGDHWGPRGDLDPLKDLALFDGQDLLDPGQQEYSERNQDEGQAPDGFNQSEPEGGSETTWISPTSERLTSPVDENRTRTSAGPVAAEQTTGPQNRTLSTAAATDSAPSDHDIITTTVTSSQPLRSSVGNPAAVTSGEPLGPSAEWTQHQPDQVKFLQNQTSTVAPLLQDVTSDPAHTCPPAAAAAGTAVFREDRGALKNPQSGGRSSENGSENFREVNKDSSADVGVSNQPPVAVVGPDRTYFLPVSSLLLDGSGSSDDHQISSFLWEELSGPPGLQLRDAAQAVATVTGLQVGRYLFRLTVWDQQGATGSASLTLKVLEDRSLPPVAHASGSHVLTLPNNSLVLRGSVTHGDQNQVQYHWTRDSQSPAAGVVLFGSETQASLYLTDLVQGTYLFQLKVTDAQARSSTATATVEVRPEPGSGEQVELELLVSVSQVSVSQRDTMVRQLAALIHVLDRDIQVRALQDRTQLSSVLRFSVLGPSGPVPASSLVVLLRKQLLRGKSDFLLFRVLRVDAVVCQLSCSGRGQCDPITKQCACDPFWTENLIRRYLGDGESNCDWRLVLVILSSFLMMIFILTLSWTFICCSRRRNQNQGRRRTRYSILDDMDEQERLQLRPRFSIKHRSTEHNSSLMMSESDLDTDQDSVFSRPGRTKNRTRTQVAQNGNSFR
ncbi:dyslexia-associated protein KIAA0319 homolog isoform X2 [Austrofundulus limnaeus]|uniref:Dyslexia-associated protein KIAA0319 homolog isoform X2 n=1 Tax=Austrofundulus limnaeus TaxID=52670 RepID=A0A2I4DCJ9_AUSLI|nr:PREDICTED: dyslexia-associated protein KIAA0319 homolog isoform X2 [Austrofundulus limnaeus]